MTPLPIYRLIVLFLFGLSSSIFAQDRQIAVDGPSASLGLDDEMVYTVTIKSLSTPFNGVISTFPNFEGFAKGVQKMSHSRFVEGGKAYYMDVVRQVYTPQKAGLYKLPSFQIIVDKQVYLVNSEEVLVTSTLDKISLQSVVTITKEQAQNAFLSLTPSKKDIFVGEGVLVDVSFYVPDVSQSDWEFPKDITEQVEQIARKIKPLDCLENRLTITNIKGEPTQIQGNKFTKYQLFLAWYYPLNPKSISLPAVQFTPQKKAKTERSSFSPFTMTTQPQVISVKELPEHPLKGKVVVGVFELSEKIQKNPVEIGRPFRYTVKVEGVGNLTLGSSLVPKGDDKLDIYSETAAKILAISFPRSAKEYAFQIIPKKLESIPLEEYFRFYFFNSQTQKYDTLVSKITLQVVGDSSSLGSLATRNTDIYDGLGDIPTPDSFLNKRVLFLQIATGLLICMLIATGFLFFTNKKQ